MRILLINQFFWPDLAPTSQLLTDVADHMVSRGHDVTVVCARHSYAGTDITARPAVRVIHIPDIAFARGRAKRALSYFSFLAGSSLAAVLAPRHDIVVTMTTPPLLCLVGLVVQRLRSARHYIWEMDLFPDAAIDVRMLRADSLATRVMGGIADFARRRASGIIVLGECMRARVIARGISPQLVEIAENWADGALLHPVPRRFNGPLTLVYAGNLGLAHDIETIADTMRRLKSNPGIRFLFVGGGPQFEPLKRICESEQIATTCFLPYCSRDRLNELFSQSDIGLVTQVDSSLGSLVPSKAYSLMAAGLPLLFIGPAASTLSTTIRRFACGWELRCGESDRVAELLQRLGGERALVEEAGVHARDAFLNHYDKPVGVERVCSALRLAQAT